MRWISRRTYKLMPTRPASIFNGSAINHFTFTKFMDFRETASKLGCVGKKNAERLVTDHLRKLSSKARKGVKTKYEISNPPGTALYINDKPHVINPDATVKEIKV